MYTTELPRLAPAARALTYCAALVLALSPAASAKTESAWKAGSVKVDGAAADWSEDGITEKDGLAVSFSNDGKDLYVYAAALDKDAAAQLSGRFGQSFTLWLDGKGSRNKSFGIKLSARNARPAGGPPEGGRRPSAGAEAEDGRRSEPPAERALSTAAYETAIVYPDGENSTLEAEGVEFAAGLNRRKRPVFEFRVPLALFAVKGKDVIGAGFETSEIKSETSGGRGNSGESGSSTGRGGMGGGPGGMGGGPGGMGGGPGGMGGGPDGMGGGPGGQGGGRRGMGGGPGEQASSSAAVPDPISFWLKVKLAAKP